MTLSNSKYSRYDIDERLTIDDLAVVQGPLESKKERNGTNIGSCTSFCTTQSSASTSTSPTQRSIFSAYWKTDSRLSRLPPSLISSSEVEKQQQQHSQRRRRRIFNKTYTYTYDGDPYQFFGIEEEKEGETSTTDDDDSDSLNSYEGILQKNEVGVSEKNHRSRRRSRTCPSLSFERVGMQRTIVGSTEKTMQSDTVLFSKTSSSLQRLSCLRKSRFAVDANADINESDSSTQSSNNNGKRKGEQHRTTSVSFEARIQVRLFRPPVENWAPIGWSNWFGGWQ